MQNVENYGIIRHNFAKNITRRRVNIILKPKFSHYTKDLAKIVIIAIITGFLLILASIFIKYEPGYEVTIAAKKLGYIENVSEFEKLIEENVINKKGTNIANVELTDQPVYKKVLVERNMSLNDQDIIDEIKENNVIITYKYYEVSLNDEIRANVDTLEDAEEVVNTIKEEFDGDGLDLDLQINEYYTENIEDLNTETVEVASTAVETAAEEVKEEKEKNEALAIINDIKLSVLPVTGRITSRYGVASSIRRSAHTGLDIACTQWTDIKAISAGTVTFSNYKGSYGNLVKIDHGNGVETWYGHCSKLYVDVGTKVAAGDVIAAVGSTGNSTGPHLHFEIRINGKTVDPQNYVY